MDLKHSDNFFACFENNKTVKITEKSLTLN